MLARMENQTEIFVTWLKWFLSTRKMTAKDLAKRSGVCPTTISSYKRDRTRPDYEHQVMIIKGAGVTWGDMLKIGRRESKPKPEMISYESTEVTMKRIHKVLEEIEALDPARLIWILDNLEHQRNNLVKKREADIAAG